MLLLDKDGLQYSKLFGFDFFDESKNHKHINKQHIYITCDEKVKDGDWFYHPNKALASQIIKASEFTNNQGVIIINGFNGYMCEKVILTTDPDLIADGVQAVDGDFLEWFVDNSDCEFVEVKKECNYGNCACFLGKCVDDENIYKIIIPQRKPCTQQIVDQAMKDVSKDVRLPKVVRDGIVKQETLEDASWKYNPLKKFDGEFIRVAFKAGAKWQAERSFTLEQIDELFIGDKNGGYFDDFLDYRLGLNGNQGKNKITFKEWFEQHRKR